MAWWFHAATFLYLAGLVLTVGAAAARAWVRVPAALPLVAALVLAVGVVARLLAQVQGAFGEAGGLTRESVRVIVFDTPWGWGWRWQATAAAAVLLLAVARAAGAAGPAYAQAGRVAPDHAGLAAALGAAATAALTGHAQALPDVVWLMAPLHAVHVAAAGLWLGALAVLLVSLPLAARGGADAAIRRQAVAAAVARFSALAIVAVALTAGTGSLIAVLHIGTWEALVATPYGRVLLLKVAAFLAAGACGAYNWRRVRPALAFENEASSRLRQVGGLEVAAGLIVLLLTSLLVALPMPAEPE